MSSELERRIQDRLPGMPMSRSVRRDINKIVAETGKTILKSDAGMTVEIHNMENVGTVVDAARAIAGDDELKMAVLSEHIRDYSARVRRTQRNLLGW